MITQRLPHSFRTSVKIKHCFSAQAECIIDGERLGFALLRHRMDMPWLKWLKLWGGGDCLPMNMKKLRIQIPFPSSEAGSLEGASITACCYCLLYEMQCYLSSGSKHLDPFTIMKAFSASYSGETLHLWLPEQRPCLPSRFRCLLPKKRQQASLHPLF